MSRGRRVIEFNELTRKHKRNSLDVINAWGMVDASDELVEQMYEDGDFDWLIKCYDKHNGYTQHYYSEYNNQPEDDNANYKINQHTISKEESKRIIKGFANELEELYQLINSGMFVVNWNSNGAFVTLSKTININKTAYDRYVEKKRDLEDK